MRILLPENTKNSNKKCKFAAIDLQPEPLTVDRCSIECQNQYQFMDRVRVRFAPSPTGALHIGGVRTALYNYLFARKQGGTFILRIEDTDQNRFVDGAEEYILQSLKWCGIDIDEGPSAGGEYGPYRQSERKDLYRKYALELIQNGFAYYAFDTPEELDHRRQLEKEKGNHTFKYDGKMRMQMRNSLTLPAKEVSDLLEKGAPFTIRLKVPQDETIQVNDLVRGKVVFQGSELDDKVIFKADGMPTYHLANIIDDKLMAITHVIRGEEWLPSTAHHVLLYRGLNWQDDMPEFAHLPLILKPNGKGKLSKRDGNKLGIPVFPLSWEGKTEDDSFRGFREFGFDPRAVVNFLAFLGWNPGTEQEIFSLEELCDAFSVANIGKAGARFDFDKAKWFNQQYIMTTDNRELARMIYPGVEARGYGVSEEFLVSFCGLMKERVIFYNDFFEKGYYFFEPVRSYDDKMIRKKWKADKKEAFGRLSGLIAEAGNFTQQGIRGLVEQFMQDEGLKFGDVLPILRLAMSGTTKGPAIFEMMELLGRTEVLKRIGSAYAYFDNSIEQVSHKTD